MISQAIDSLVGLLTGQDEGQLDRRFMHRMLSALHGLAPCKTMWLVYGTCSNLVGRLGTVRCGGADSATTLPLPLPPNDDTVMVCHWTAHFERHDGSNN